MKRLTATNQVLGLIKKTIVGFVEDDALSHGAAIAFFTVTSMAPLLLVTAAVAGVAFGNETAQNAIVNQLVSLTGPEFASFFQSVLEKASTRSSSTLASVIGIFALGVTISGVFGELQTALNTIWKIKARTTTISRFIRARAVSFGLVVAMGFLLMTSLAVSAALAALGDFMQSHWPGLGLVLIVLNFLISFFLIALMFAAIFKVLPDRSLHWRDVILGGVSTSLLFAIGKYLIAAYLVSSGIATTYGAAGALILLLLWVYYTAQILLLGAEFTKAYAQTFGSRKNNSIKTIETAI